MLNEVLDRTLPVDQTHRLLLLDIVKSGPPLLATFPS